MGSGSTHVLVDTPKSIAVDARSKAQALVSLTARANLLGNVMASPPVRAYIARRAHISPDQIQAVAPLTPDVPRALAEPGHEKRTSDILRSTDQYRMEIQAQPTAPVLDIYTQAPSADAARVLADAAVAGLRDYLATLARTQDVAPSDQVRLIQLGEASSGVINRGIRIQVALLSSILVFCVSAAAVLWIARVRRGWRAADEPEWDEEDRDEPDADDLWDERAQRDDAEPGPPARGADRAPAPSA
jgi:hypothetical protein